MDFDLGPDQRLFFDTLDQATAGATIRPERMDFARVKEYLLTGDPIPAPPAAAMGLINHAVPDAELDARVDAFCDRPLSGATRATRGTRVTVNLELKRIAHALMDPGLALEALSVRRREHRDRVAALAATRARKAA